jgi:hypothetical protein
MFEDVRPIEETEMTIARGLLQEMCQEVGNREYALTEIGNDKDHAGTMDESSLHAARNAGCMNVTLMVFTQVPWSVTAWESETP